RANASSGQRSRNTAARAPRDAAISSARSASAIGVAITARSTGSGADATSETEAASGTAVPGADSTAIARRTRPGLAGWKASLRPVAHGGSVDGSSSETISRAARGSKSGASLWYWSMVRVPFVGGRRSTEADQFAYVQLGAARQRP